MRHLASLASAVLLVSGRACILGFATSIVCYFSTDCLAGGELDVFPFFADAHSGNLLTTRKSSRALLPSLPTNRSYGMERQDRILRRNPLRRGREHLVERRLGGRRL